MTDTAATGPAPSRVPESLRSAIEDLWRLSMRWEEGVHRSGAFRALKDTCRSVYLGVEESRLHRAPSVGVTPSVLSQALHNFFRWNGAPWFRDRTPDAAETATSLHRAFLRQSVRRTYLVPLDRLSLEDSSGDSTQEVTSIRFGPNEIVRLDGDDLARRVPVNALARFGARYQFPTADLDGFCWLVTSRAEPAGPLEKRTWLGLLNTALIELDTYGLFRSTYPPHYRRPCTRALPIRWPLPFRARTTRCLRPSPGLGPPAVRSSRRPRAPWSRRLLPLIRRLFGPSMCACRCAAGSESRSWCPASELPPAWKTQRPRRPPIARTTPGRPLPEAPAPRACFR